MSYFKKNYKNLYLQINAQKGRSGLRECQEGAFWATYAHFTASNAPALIIMPTGSGKTAVIMLLAFGLRASRILVIEPAVILRDQTADKFRSLDDLIKAKVLPRNIKRPIVNIQERRMTSADMWEDLREYDVVVATPHTISPDQHRDIVPPPGDLFDVVFFDEAHHTPARTWDALLNTFKSSKRILLTATPFRQDRRNVRAHMVYYYPLGRAIDSGIYGPIQYHPVLAPRQEDKDILLCDKARELLTEEKNKSRRTKILIRTDRVRKCNFLINLYRSRGINVDEVNYMKSLEDNRAVLDGIKSDQLDGVVCVGMLGEGLDIPELKIAVFHDPPRSLPFTLQFIGRISRSSKGQIGDAHVIANPDDVKGEMRRLYRQDVHWRDLVPKLVDEAVGQVALQSKFHQTGSIVGDLDIDSKEITPFFSARLYKVEPDNLDLGLTLDLGDKIYIPFSEYLDNGNFLIVITISEYKPPWAERLELSSIRYDLHLYYYHRLSGTLFESTTSDDIAGQIRRQIITKEVQRLKGEELIRVMQSQKAVNYLMVGLANVLGRTPSLPTYKILMGKEVEGAVRPTEGRVFTPGHALAKVSEQETRGIGNFQGRVWAIKRGSLMEFKDWCDAIGNQLIRHKATTLPGLEFLPNPQRVRKFPACVIAVLFNYRALVFSLKLVSIKADSDLDMSSPEFELKNLSQDRRTLSLRLYPNLRDVGIDLKYDIANNQWTVVGGTPYKLRVDTGGEVRYFTLNEFLLEYPPYIYLGNGGLIVNGNLHQSKHTYDTLPKECFAEEIDWSGCDITVEFANKEKNIQPSEGKKTIHDWLQDKLIKDTGEGAVILKDHGKGEIADFVVVEPKEKNIGFYHCKPSSKVKPGARINDLNKVIEQAFRSIMWVRRGDLLSLILKRAESKNRPGSKLVKGTLEILKNLDKEFSNRYNEWNYQVVIVQPGLDCKKSIKSQNTNTLLLNCYEWLYHNFGTSLLIMGYIKK